LKQQRAGAHVAQVLEAHVGTLADDAGVAGDGRADQRGAEGQDGFVVEAGAEAFFGQLDPVAFDAGKLNFQRVALRAHGLDLHRLARRLGRADDGLGGEVEGDAEDIGVFDVEQAFFVEVVGLAA
jgi:hypothetical protein